MNNTIEKKAASSLRKELSKYDIDPGYICKLFKDQIVRNAIELDPGTVLDFGCDTAYMAKLLDVSGVNYEYLGVDIRDTCNPSNLEGDRIAAFTQESNPLAWLKTLPDNSWDHVLILDVIEHMKNKEEGLELFNEALRVAKYKVFMSTPNSGTENKINWPEYHEYEFTYDELCEFVQLNKYIKFYKSYGWSMSDEVYNNLSHADKVDRLIE